MHGRDRLWQRSTVHTQEKLKRKESTTQIEYEFDSMTRFQNDDEKVILPLELNLSNGQNVLHGDGWLRSISQILSSFIMQSSYSFDWVEVKFEEKGRTIRERE